jgi:hypothetical protein
VATPHNQSTGPPTTVGEGPDDSGTPQDNSDAVVIDNEGESPLAPPPDAATIVEPGGSPTDEAIAGIDPSITSLEPTTGVVGSDITVTVTGTMFGDDAVVEVDQAEVATTNVSNTELTAVLTDPGAAGTVAVTVRNANDQESNSVDFTWTAAGRSVLTGHIREDSK